MRVPFKGVLTGLFTVILSPWSRCLMKEFVLDSEVGATIAVALAIVLAYCVVTILDWMLWEPIGKEHAETRRAIRQFELVTSIVLGDLSRKRSARKWWRPVRHWWLRRKYGDA